MLTNRRLADAELLGNENAADAVGHKVAVRLRPEMLFWMPQPVENQAATVTGQSLPRLQAYMERMYARPHASLRIKEISAKTRRWCALGNNSAFASIGRFVV